MDPLSLNYQFGLKIWDLRVDLGDDEVRYYTQPRCCELASIVGGLIVSMEELSSQLQKEPLKWFRRLQNLRAFESLPPHSLPKVHKRREHRLLYPDWHR